MEINADYVIRRTILFDNKCGFVLGENPKAPNPYVTWQFNEQDGHRDYFWGHYHNEPGMAERDLHNRAEDYQRRYHVQEVEQAPDKVLHEAMEALLMTARDLNEEGRAQGLLLYPPAGVRRGVSGVGGYHLCPALDGSGNAGL